MAGFRKPTLPNQSSYNSVYVNPLTDSKHHHTCSEGDLITKAFTDNKENIDNAAMSGVVDKENAVPNNSKPLSANGSLSVLPKPKLSNMKSLSTGRVLKPSSLQLCMQMNEPEKVFKAKIWDSVESEKSNSVNIWDYSDSEAAPASSWSSLPNRALLCRPLPLDIGRCTCVIMKEALPEGLDGGTLYSLYTNEGQGRQDRKLAIAHHKRRNGKSEFTIAQNLKGVFSSSDDSFVGNVTANLMGSKYHIWDQGGCVNSKRGNLLLAVVTFMPTIATWTGSYRSMRAYVPRYQSMQLKNTTLMQHVNGLARDWEGKMDKVHKLCSRTPRYNNMSKQYELDFRDRGRAGLRIQSSVKNFQLTMEENGKQTILQLGRVGKSKFVMDFRYPLTGYQAFCICLASMDSKLCCSM
ncbi:TUBBY-LIKE PROTEIN 8 [Salix koriyanagi]|uniref:TUBBY-LIKE PROTEIN 8 n=1 Tax=Salix koriyanagi TaxID=2511006 RepID=A0A9Q0T6J0_9ROSI|nr:TUBBY-LIKE PROTEIN 8 [Salix koriyanagi]